MRCRQVHIASGCNCCLHASGADEEQGRPFDLAAAELHLLFTIAAKACHAQHTLCCHTINNDV